MLQRSLRARVGSLQVCNSQEGCIFIGEKFFNIAISIRVDVGIKSLLDMAKEKDYMKNNCS